MFLYKSNHTLQYGSILIAIHSKAICNMALTHIVTSLAYWIAQRAVKMVYDHVDGLQRSPHDITTVQDRMNAYFKVCAT